MSTRTVQVAVLGGGSWGTTVASLLGACARAMARWSTGGAGWEALLDRGMAVDFDWTTGSPPRYVEAYRRAVAIRRAT